MKNLTCVCCGAPINRKTMRCEYCGTQYEIENDIPKIRFETFQNPVKEYKACVYMSDYDAMHYGEEAMKYSIERLAHEMLPAVMEGMEIVRQHDIELMQQRLIGRVKIVIPKNSERSWI